MPQALPDIGCWPAGASLVRGSCPGTTAKGTDLWPIALGLNILGSGWAIDSFYNCPFTINRLQGMSLDHAESIECPTGGEGVPPPRGLTTHCGRYPQGVPGSTTRLLPGLHVPFYILWDRVLEG